MWERDLKFGIFTVTSLSNGPILIFFHMDLTSFLSFTKGWCRSTENFLEASVLFNAILLVLIVAHF